MPDRPTLFRVNPETRETVSLEEVDFADLGLQERRDIQEWVARNPSVLEQDLLIVAKEFSGFDRTGERLDLLAVDRGGQLVVIELKRDDSGGDAHWQAIKYASYIHGASSGNIIDMLANYEGVEEEDARQKLIEHTGSDDDLDRLNENQRIILACHRFAPEVTSAALWLNEQAERELVTCIQMTPYRDHDSNALYLSSSTIIPVPGAEEYQIGVGSRSEDGGRAGGRYMNRIDNITVFCRNIYGQVLELLPDDVIPDKKSRWAGGNENWRYYHMWYLGPGHGDIVAWGNWKLSYRIELFLNENDEEEMTWSASVSLYNGYRQLDTLPDGLLDDLMELEIATESDDRGIWVDLDAHALDDAFAETLAQTTAGLIESATPIVRGFMENAE